MKNWFKVPVLAGMTSMAIACSQDIPEEEVVAKAGKHTLTVDQAVSLLVDEEGLPNEADLVRAVADLWIDYTLLAEALAEDSTLSGVDVEMLVMPQLRQEMIFVLRDSVIQVDTILTESEMREEFSREATDAEIRARHILLAYPASATQAQRDSVRRDMEAIRGRAVSGESFAALARQHSQDPGSAAAGGDLGTFGRGMMVRPFDEAAFALEPGEISDIVESPFGLHVILVEEKVVPDFDTVRDQFRMQMLSRRFFVAESTYVAGVEERAHPELTEDAIPVVRDLAGDPNQFLASRAARRALVSYEGGALTVGEFQNFLQTAQPQWPAQIASGTDQQVEGVLKGLAQQELLAAEAEAAGLGPSPERMDSLFAEARTALRDVAGRLGLTRLDAAPGEEDAAVLRRTVLDALTKVVTGQVDAVQFGPLGQQLRRGNQVTISESGLGRVVTAVADARLSRGPSPADQAVPGEFPDSAGE